MLNKPWPRRIVLALWLLCLLLMVWYCTPAKIQEPRAQTIRIDPRLSVSNHHEQDRSKYAQTAYQIWLDADDMIFCAPAAFSVAYDEETQRAVILLDFRALIPNQRNEALRWWNMLPEESAFDWLRDRYHPQPVQWDQQISE